MAEYENELSKLDFARQYLKDVKGSNILTDDFVPSYLYYRSTFKTKQDANNDDEN